MTEKTVTVNSHFGDKQVTREDFVEQWMSHGRQISNLNFDFWMKIRKEYEEVAGQEWDELLVREGKTD